MLSESCLCKKPRRTSDIKNFKMWKKSPWCLSPSSYTFIRETWQRRKDVKNVDLSSSRCVKTCIFIWQSPVLVSTLLSCCLRTQMQRLVSFWCCGTWQQHQDDRILQGYSLRACDACCPAGQTGRLPGCPAGVRLSLTTGRSWVSSGWRLVLLSVWGAAAPSASAAAASGIPPPAAPGGTEVCWVHMSNGKGCDNPGDFLTIKTVTMAPFPSYSHLFACKIWTCKWWLICCLCHTQQLIINSFKLT